MRYGVLGPVQVTTDAGTPVRVPELKVRALLAALLVDPGRPVPSHRLIDALWGDDPDRHPAQPLRALQAKASQLRRVLDEAEPGARDAVVSRSPGYLVDPAAGALDTHRFADLAARARTTDDLRARTGLLTSALELWRGPAFADFADEPFALAAAHRLEEDRAAVVEELAEARLALGEHAALIGELADLVARHPLRERLRAVQLKALYRAGRQSEALAAYEELRTRLADDLGLDPGPELVALHRAVLTQDPGLTAAPVPPAPAAPRSNLPAPLTGLVGRDQAVAEVAELLSSARLVSLTGPGGVGKTRLAVAVGERLTPDFPDGVWLTELAALPDGAGTEEVAAAVTAALGIRDDGSWGSDADTASVSGRLAAALRPRDMLLVLDNCEHLVESVAVLAGHLLRAAPGLRILATSQETLAVPGESVWNVPTLSLPRRRRALRRPRGRPHPRRHQHPGRGGRLPSPRRHPARPRTRRHPGPRPRRAPPPRPARRPLPRPRRLRAARCARPPADPARDDRLELGTPHRPRTRRTAPPRRPRRRLHGGGRRGGVRGR